MNQDIIMFKKVPLPRFQLDKGETHDPISCLSLKSCKPFKKIDKPIIKMLVLLPSDSSKDEKKYLNKLITDVQNGIKEVNFSRKWKGFPEIFDLNLEAEYQNFDTMKKEKYITNLINEIDNNYKNYDFITIYLPEDSKSRIGGPYFRVKIHTILKNIKEQIIIRPTIEKVKLYTESSENRDFFRYNDLVWNFSLSIFSKLGGVPWMLKTPMDPVDIFIGLSTIIKTGGSRVKRKAGIAVLQMYNAWGEYRSSAYGKLVFVYEHNRGILHLEKGESEEKISQLVATLVDDVKNKNVVIHLSDLYSRNLYDTIYNSLITRGAADVKIIRIQSTSPLRLYKNLKLTESRYAWPEIGAYWFLEPGRIAQLYTTGKWRYYRKHPPYAVPAHSIRPIQISLEYPDEPKLNVKDLRDILWLTKLYPYMLDAPRSRLPIDIKLSQKYAQLVASDENIGILKDETFLY